MAPRLALPEAFVDAARALRDDVAELTFAEPVTHVYNPLAYAWSMHAAYLRRAAPRAQGSVLFLGMNPGPWGMAQTGVPFGEVATVRDWMGLEGEVGRPEVEHPKRPIEGLACGRSEVSGRRLWGLVAARFGALDGFAAQHVVMNYCPLVFMEASGRNRTPDKLPAAERIPLERACDRHLARIIEVARPRWVVGIGAFAERCARRILEGEASRSVGAPRVGRVLHPSPASPAANRGWADQAIAQLEALGVW